jgi:hypothetical protein
MEAKQMDVADESDEEAMDDGEGSDSVSQRVKGTRRRMHHRTRSGSR